MNRTQKTLAVTALIVVVGLSLALVSLLTPHSPDMGGHTIINTTINTSIKAENVVISDSSIGSYSPAIKADEPAASPAITITKTPVISYELDLLQLFNYEHGDVFTGNDDVSVTTVPSKGRDASVIVFDTCSDNLNPDDFDKKSPLCKMLTINTHKNVRAADSGEMEFNFTSKTFVSFIQFLDVDHGSATLFAYDESGNLITTIKLHHGEDGQVQTMNVNLTVSKMVIKVNDSFAVLPHFRAFSEGELKAFSLPKTSIADGATACAVTADDAKTMPWCDGYKPTR